VRVGERERLCFAGIKMTSDSCFSVCDSLRNLRDWNIVVECIECRLEIRMGVNAVFEFLANDWRRTDPGESYNHP